MKEPIERIIIVEEKVKANLKRSTCPQCSRVHFTKIAEDGSVVELCAVCLGLFDENEKRN